MTNRVTVIEWVDSVSKAGGLWHDPGQVRTMEPGPIISVGFIQSESPDHVTLASHITSQEVGGDICIPRVAITKIRHFSIKPKRSKRKAK